MDPLLWFALIVAAAWLGLDALRVKELARRAAEQACSRAEVHLLDDTVARQRLRLCRDGAGRMRMCREYRFEFTRDGAYRYQGSVELTGHRVRKVELEPYRI